MGLGTTTCRYLKGDTNDLNNGFFDILSLWQNSSFISVYAPLSAMVLLPRGEAQRHWDTSVRNSFPIYQFLRKRWCFRACSPTELLNMENPECELHPNTSRRAFISVGSGQVQHLSYCSSLCWAIQDLKKAF